MSNTGKQARSDHSIMGYHTQQQIVLVPAAKVDMFNAFMQRNGYGPAMLVPHEGNALGDKADAKAKAPTHYSLEIPSADDGIIAAARKALAKCNDKMAEKDKGVEKAGFKGNTSKLSPVNVEKLAEEKGLKKKIDDTKPVDGQPVDEGEVK